MEFLDELRSLKDQIRFNGRFEIPEGTKNVVIAGMGGSGIVGRIFSELYSEIPVSIVDDYRAPDFVGKETLYIAISYSGNTEETIDSVNDAKAKGAITLAITSGGKLAKLADKTVVIPKGLNPRSALGYMLAPLATSFGIAGDKEIDEAYKLLNELDENNEAEKGIAREIYSNESIPVIYGIAPYKAVAYRWKTQFSENAKVLAYSSSFPELNHNDTMSLDGTYRKGEFYFMAFTDGENPKVERRIGITENLTGIGLRRINAKGTSAFARMMWLVHEGDYITFHLAVLRGKNPANVAIIEQLKKELGKQI
jgi:glucose/mannose-6-phosphate isomerase